MANATIKSQRDMIENAIATLTEDLKCAGIRYDIVKAVESDVRARLGIFI